MIYRYVYIFRIDFYIDTYLIIKYIGTYYYTFDTYTPKLLKMTNKF